MERKKKEAVLYLKSLESFNYIRRSKFIISLTNFRFSSINLIQRLVCASQLGLSYQLCLSSQYQKLALEN